MPDEDAYSAYHDDDGQPRLVPSRVLFFDLLEIKEMATGEHALDALKASSPHTAGVPRRYRCRSALHGRELRVRHDHAHGRNPRAITSCSVRTTWPAARRSRLLAYRQRVGGTFERASSSESDFRFDFGGSATAVMMSAALSALARNSKPAEVKGSSW